MKGKLVNSQENNISVPEINRRRMLLGLAAASTAAATITAAAAVAPSISPVENPELIRLADELRPIMARYTRARRREKAIVREWAPQWPVAPADLEIEKWQNGTLERDFYGAHHGRNILDTQLIDWRRWRARSALRSRATKNPWHSYWTREEWETELREADRLYDLAARYEAETDYIKKASGFDASWKECHAAVSVVATHVAAIMEQPDRTMAGLLIKAEALASWNRVGEHDRLLGLREANRWHGQIAESVLRHAKGGAA